MKKPTEVGRGNPIAKQSVKIVKRWSRGNKSDIENRIAENECEQYESIVNKINLLISKMIHKTK